MALSKAGVELVAEGAGQYFAQLGRADDANAAFGKSSEAAAKQVADFGRQANQIKLTTLNNQLADQKTKLAIASAELKKMGENYDFTSKAAQNKAAALQKLQAAIGVTEQKISLFTSKMEAEAKATTQSAQATDKAAKEFSDFGSSAAKSEQGVGSLIGTVGKLGAAYLGASAIASKAFEGFALGAELDQARRTLGTLMGDVERGNKVYESAIAFGQQYGYTQREMANASAAAAGIFKRTNETTEKTLEVLGRLASMNPTEGFEGATFALKELASGDIMSIVERFGLAKDQAYAMRDAIAAGADPVRVLDEALNGLGVTNEVLANRMEGSNGALLRAKLAGESTMLSMGQLLETLGAVYILEAFAAGLNTIAEGISNVATGVANFFNQDAMFTAAVVEGTARMMERGAAFSEYEARMASVGQSAQALTQAEYEAAQAMIANGTAANEAIAAAQTLSDTQGVLVDALEQVALAGKLDEESKAALIERTMELADNSPEAAAAVAELTEELSNTEDVEAFTTGLDEQSAALDALTANQEFAASTTFGYADAQAAAVVETDNATASIYDVSDATYEQTAASLEAAIAAENQARFQDDLAAATAAAGDSAVATAIFSQVLAAQYGMEANEVANLIALTNELNKARAGQQGNAAARAAAAAANKAFSAPGGVAGYTRANQSRAARAERPKRGGGAGRSAGKSKGGKGRTGAGKGKKEKEVDPVEEARKAAEDAGKIAESLSKLRTFIAPSQANIDAYTGALAAITMSFGQRAQEIGGALTKETGEFAKTAGEVVDTVGKGVEAFKKLQDYSSPPRANIEAFTDDMAAIVREFGARSKEISVELASDTILFATTAGEAVDTVAQGVEAFKLLKDFAPIPQENIALFSLALRDTVREFGERTKEVDLRLAEDTALFADTANKAISTIAGGVEGFAKLEDFASPTQESIALFSLAVRDTIREFGERTKEINLDLLESTGAFADTAGKTIDIIGSGVEGFTQLQDYQGVPQAKLELFGRDIAAAVRVTESITAQFNAEGVAAAADFADSAGRVIAPISTGVESFSKLKDYEGVATERMMALFHDIRQAINLMIIIKDTSDQEGVAAAAAFSASVTTVFDAMSSGIDALDALRDYQAVPAERMASFEADFNTAVATMQRLAGAGTVLEADGDRWKTSLENFASSIRAGMDAVAALNGLSVNVSASVSASAGDSGAAIPAMAWGGRPTPGMPVLVGDNNGKPTRFSELFIPDRPGTILPSKMTLPLLGGAGYRPPASAQQQYNDYQTSQMTAITNNYNLGVTTNQSPQVLQQSFGQMQAYADAGF